MRRANFFIAALVAIATYASLTAFIGRRPLGWRRGWRQHPCYYDDRTYDRQQETRNAPLHDSVPIH